VNARGYRLESRTLLADGAYRVDHVQDYTGPDGRTMALFDWQVEVECSGRRWYAPGAGRRLVVVEVAR
jgi:hypothetical protein